MTDTTLERLHIEMEDLIDRLRKLKSFIGTGPYFGLSLPQQYLLLAQRDAMETYYSILNARSMLWGGEE